MRAAVYDRLGSAELARAAGADAVVDYRAEDAASAVRAAAPDGVDRIVEVALGANLELDLRVLAQNGTVVTYAQTGPDPAADEAEPHPPHRRSPPGSRGRGDRQGRCRAVSVDTRTVLTVLRRHAPHQRYNRPLCPSGSEGRAAPEVPTRSLMVRESNSLDR